MANQLTDASEEERKAWGAKMHEARARKKEEREEQGQLDGLEGDEPDEAKPIRQRPPGAGAKKKKKAKPSARGPGRPSRADRVEILEDALTDRFVKLGSGLTLALPVTGLVFVERSPKRAAALCALARRNPRILEALERMIAGAQIFDLAEDVGALALAVAVDLGRAEPDTIVARALGVDQAYDQWAKTEGSADGEIRQAPIRRSSFLDDVAGAPAS
jgi:ribosomal protein S8E